MRVVIFNICIVTVFFISCNNHKQDEEIYSVKNKHIVKSLYRHGHLYSVQSFTKDTIPDGAEIIYYENGKMQKWKWYDIDYQADKVDSVVTLSENRKEFQTIQTGKEHYWYPACIAYYDSFGKFDTLVGKVFIKTKHIDKIFCIGIASPPRVLAKIILTDSEYHNKPKQYLYEPSPVDTICWVQLPDFHYKAGHDFFLDDLIIDSANHYYMTTGIQILNDKIDYLNRNRNK